MEFDYCNVENPDKQNSTDYLFFNQMFSGKLYNLASKIKGLNEVNTNKS